MDESHDDRDLRHSVEPGHLTAVRDLLGSHEPSPDTVAAGRARLLAEAAAPATVRDLAPAGRKRRHRRIGAGLSLAAAAAAAVLVPTVMSGGTPPIAARPGTSIATTAGPTARQILLAAATTVERARTTGDYWRVGTVHQSMMLDPSRGYVIAQKSSTELWLAERPELQNWRIRRYLGAKPASPEDEAAWRAAGAPASWRYPEDFDTDELYSVPYRRPLKAAAGEPSVERLHGHWNGAAGDLTQELVTWRQVRAIPSDPDKLRAYLKQRVIRQLASPDMAELTGAEREKEIVHGLRADCLAIISSLPVAPEVRASAYRVLASLPGIRAEGETTDPLGRRGQAVGYQVEFEPGRFTDVRFLVDPGTGLPLAEVWTNTGRLADGRPVELRNTTSYQAIGWTDERPEVPERRN
ncbi:hypothetical protein Sru01_43660 [Sphaerisporangium rufum]|uniref:CU044_5270 family protein n=1 Tax=Sphaerisporangium rufum TaxID=1381558 RepID=A0A919R4G0_9ACTN|nr:CU044_5270 family protein [Sphaerisporangium rufum]GII79384.1 hypothetical protein Sru01_43660 [Sphaerisporangium rufum]